MYCLTAAKIKKSENVILEILASYNFLVSDIQMQ